jgi:hypothetical protein
MVKHFKIILIATAVVSILLLYFFLDARKGGFPACPFWSVTGLYCPGCGSQRSISALLHGDLWDAMRYNALLVATIPILLINGYRHLRRKSSGQNFLYQPWFTKTVLIIVMAFWVLRNIPAHPFMLLSPMHP